MLVQARHDLDEIAGPVAVVELVHQDIVPAVAAGAGGAWQAENVSCAGDAGVSSGALTMIEQPAARPAESFLTTWLIGKFHGVKAATGPTGSLIAIW